MPADSVQMQLVRRYSRILREKQAEYRGPRIGARERRRERTEPGRDVTGGTAQRVVDVVTASDAPAT